MPEAVVVVVLEVDDVVPEVEDVVSDVEEVVPDVEVVVPDVEVVVPDVEVVVPDIEVVVPDIDDVAPDVEDVVPEVVFVEAMDVDEDSTVRLAAATTDVDPSFTAFTSATMLYAPAGIPALIGRLLTIVTALPGCSVPSELSPTRDAYGDVNNRPAGTIQNVTDIELTAPFCPVFDKDS